MTKGIALTGILLSTPKKEARIVVTGIEHKTPEIYVPHFSTYIMVSIRCIPAFVLKRMSL